ncbi:MAG: Maf family protein [Flavobacteriia bacterium]|jgi:septum formation protein
MKIILGSKSPRRKDLLTLLGYEFEIRVKETDESFPQTIPVTEVAQLIAEKKANDILCDLQDDEIVICADTTVVIDNHILGKPINRAEAIAMLQKLSGREHHVITGVVVCSRYKKICFSVTTKVMFKPLNEEEISYYVDTYAPYDKAGSYGIQEWIGGTAIQWIHGSYNNVVGLPTHEVYLALKEFE